MIGSGRISDGPRDAGKGGVGAWPDSSRRRAVVDRDGRGADHPRMESTDPARLAEAEAWRNRDLAVVWHPCTQMKEHPGTLPLVPIRRGRGA